jgi:hypothetical protein
VVDWDAAVVLWGHVFVSPFLCLGSGCGFLLMGDRYVAMHAMQEDSGHEHSTSNGYADGGSSQRKQQKSHMRDTLAAVGGMLIPLLTHIGRHI